MDDKTNTGERVVYGNITPEAATPKGVEPVTGQELAGARVVQGVASDTGVSTLDNLDKVRLHEERAKVEVLREQVGAVSIRKVLVERTEMVPVTLSREVLHITVHAAPTGTAEAAAGTPVVGKVVLDGQELVAGQNYEFVIKDERPVVGKEVYAVSDVTLHKEMQQTTHTEQVTLRREELEVIDPNGLVREITETK